MPNDLPEKTAVAGRRWPLWGQRAAMTIGALALLDCWAHVLPIWIAFGPHPIIWSWFFGGLVSLALLIGLAAWQAPRGSVQSRWRSGWTWALGLGWTVAGMAIWYATSSPFSRDVSIATLYSITTWWLLWVWLMHWIAWRWPARLSLLAVFLAALGVFLIAVRADGFDGDARPKLVWRLAPSVADPPLAATIEPVQPSAPGDAADADTTSGYPRFRGSDGLAILRDKKLARDWSRQKPRVRWRHAVGAGWSAMAVAGGQVFTQEQHGDDECVVAYDRNTGRQLWVHRDPAHYKNSGAGDGPRATPSVDGGVVFSLGSTGLLNCLDSKTGKLHWTTDILKDNDALAPIHGMTSSPLVVNDLVVVSAGGAKDASLVAYDKATGRRAWGGGSDPTGYTSPQLILLAGVPQILIITTKNVNAHDPSTGKVLWSFAWENVTSTNCSQPCPVGENRLFVSTDYGTGCALIELAQARSGPWTATRLWSNRGMQTKFCSAVVHAGNAYGLDDGILECVSLEDGRRRWKRGHYGHGQLLLANDLLVIVAEDGRLVVVEATPQEHRELSTFQALEGKTWNHPALAGRELFLRNDREAACYELPLETN